MKHQKYMYRFLVVTLVVLAFSFVSIGSLAHAETLSATDQAAADSTLESLEAQAAAADIGVRIVNGVKVFHTKDGQDLKMCTRWDGSDGVVCDAEILTVARALAAELHPQMGTEIPGDSNQRTMSPMSIATVNPVCYSMTSSLWALDTVGYGPGKMQSVGCYVTCAAMEAATYSGYLNGALANPRTMNNWLKTAGGFPGNDDNIDFSVVYKFPGSIIGGTEYSEDHPTWDAYWRANAFIAGTVPSHPEYKPSLPIMKMNRPASPAHPVAVPQHMCAWYSSDASHIASHNLIVQPSLTSLNDNSLKCTADSSSNNGYSPVTDSKSMRVGWKK